MTARTYSFRSNPSARQGPGQPTNPPGHQAAIRLYNLALVLQHLHERGPRSRATIASETGLNKATISSLVAELVERRLIREVGMQAGVRGRPSQILELDGDTVGAIGLEVGAGCLAGLAMNLAGEEIDVIHHPFDATRGDAGFAVERLADIAADLLARIGAEDRVPLGITVAVAGLVDSAHGVVLHGHNLHASWRNLPLRDRLRELLGSPSFPIRVENDANLAALAEYWEGVAARSPDLVYIGASLGVGSGVIVGGEILHGANGSSGEVGHMMLDPNGPPCSCGRRGCMEAFVGLGALLRDLGLDLDQSRHPPFITRRIADMAEAGDVRTLAVLAETGRWLGLGVSTMVNIFNPRSVVLGGYLAEVEPWIRDAFMTQLRDRVLAPNLNGCQLSFSTLGFRAALRGGAGLVIDGILTRPTLLSETGYDTVMVK